MRTTRTSRFFVDLHANGNPLRVTHERTVHEEASLGKRYTPASTSNTQVTRVHASKRVTRKFVYLSVSVPYGISVVLITTALVYPLDKIIIMCFTTQFAISNATIGPVTRINVCFVEFYELVIKLLRKTDLF